MGTTLSEFTRCLPTSRVLTSWDSRSTSRCFITPKRLKCGNESTISVVVRERPRRKSRIPRLVGSESAFHTGSRLSSAPAEISRTLLLAILFYGREDVVPTDTDTLAVLRIDHADRAVPQADFRSARNLLDLHFYM